MAEASGWNAQRVGAVIRLAVMLVAAVAGGFGLTVDADSLLTIASCAVALVAGVYSWWKNNNLTQAAQQAQEYLDAIKATDDEEDWDGE